METIFKKVSRSHENKLEVVTLSLRLVRRRDPDAALRLDLLASFVLQQKKSTSKADVPLSIQTVSLVDRKK